MADICAIITTSGKNAEYCELAVKSVLEQDTGRKIVTVVLDFSGESDRFLFLGERCLYVDRKGCGFCSNINYGIGIAALVGADYYLYLNDDVILPKHFVDTAIDILGDLDTGFVSGVQQVCENDKIGIEEFKKLEMPKSIPAMVEIDDLQGKWGDFSAWMMRLQTIMDVGSMDCYFDPVGIIADNDYLLRIRKRGYKAYRNYAMSYLHAKGVTQREYRPGWPQDDVLKRARLYYAQKWGVDPYTGRTEQIYEREFNSKKN